MADSNFSWLIVLFLFALWLQLLQSVAPHWSMGKDSAVHWSSSKSFGDHSRYPLWLIITTRSQVFSRDSITNLVVLIDCCTGCWCFVLRFRSLGGLVFPELCKQALNVSGVNRLVSWVRSLLKSAFSYTGWETVARLSLEVAVVFASLLCMIGWGVQPLCSWLSGGMIS